MTFDLSPRVVRVTPFTDPTQGSALAGARVLFGPIMLDAKLHQNDNGYFLTWPGRMYQEKWYPKVEVADQLLLKQATAQVLEDYNKAQDRRMSVAQ